MITDFLSDVWKESWFLMPNWKWVGLGIALVLGFLLQGLLRGVLRAVKNSLRDRMHSESLMAYILSQPIHIPVSWILVATFWLVSWNALGLHEGLRDFFKIATQLILFIAVIRLVYLAADSLGLLMTALLRRTSGSKLDSQLVPFATRTLKFMIVAFGFLMILQSFGVNVVSVMAGLGIGGLALAFGAQDTAANLFGSITILIDRPFQVGDSIKVGSAEGVVEDVGFRSTRIRTPYNSLLSIPNSTMAKESVDNLQVRPARRIRHVIGLSYDSTQQQMENFIDQTRERINQHPQVLKDQTNVAFQALNSSSLDVLVLFYIQIQTPIDEFRIQQKILFEIMDVAKKCGVEFAFPTQTLHHVMPNQTSASKV